MRSAENGPFSPLSPMSKITRSGPHAIKQEQRELHKKVRVLLNDVLPLDDCCKITDDDIIMRHLIAKQWKEKDAVASVREYAKWRGVGKVNQVASLPYTLKVKDQLHGYFGRDREGFPVYFDQPNPSALTKLAKEEKREDIINWHLVVAEMGRRLAKEGKVDRITCVLDLRHVGMSIIGNPRAMSLLKECASIDQHKYPENMRVMCIINAPGSFKVIWNTVKGFLEPRVQNKIRVVGKFAELDSVVPLENVPKEFGGKAEGFLKVYETLEKDAADAKAAALKAKEKERQLRQAKVEHEEERRQQAAASRGLGDDGRDSPLVVVSPVSAPDSPRQGASAFDRASPEETQAYSEDSSPLASGAASPPFPKADNVATPQGYASPGSMSPTFGTSFTSVTAAMAASNNSANNNSFPPSTGRRSRRTIQHRDANQQWHVVRGLMPRPLPLVCNVLQHHRGARGWAQCVVHVDEACEALEVHGFCGGATAAAATQFMPATLKSAAPLCFEACPDLKQQLEDELGVADVAFLKLAFFEGALVVAVDDVEERDAWVDWFWTCYPLCRPRPPHLATLEAELTEESLERGLLDAIPCSTV